MKIQGGTAQKVLDNFMDLHTLTQKAVVLAEPSYSLKVVEKNLPGSGEPRTNTVEPGQWQNTLRQWRQKIKPSDRKLLIRY